MSDHSLSQVPLHQMNPTDRFSDRACDYATARPSYPAAALDAILAGLSRPIVAADIGAGTGISSRLLGDRGVTVYALEPNAAMQAAAEPHSHVTFQAATAEQTDLPTASVNLVTCFQAFHWFDASQCLPEFHRILQPRGRLALVWNMRDRAHPVTQGYTDLVKRVSNNHPAESRMEEASALMSSPDFTNIQALTFPYEQVMDFTSLLGRAMSTSYVPKDAESQAILVQGFTDLCDRFADSEGRITMAYVTKVFIAEPK